MYFYHKIALFATTRVRIGTHTLSLRGRSTTIRANRRAKCACPQNKLNTKQMLN